MPPAQFISVAEEAGLIDLLGGWILREAVRQAAEWRADDVSSRRSSRSLRPGAGLPVREARERRRGGGARGDRRR